MYAGSRPTSKLRTGRNPAAGWRTAGSSSAGASDTDSWSREYKVIRGTIESERSKGGGSKEPIVTRDGFGENKDGRRGWWAGRRSGKVEKARRDGETGGRRWETGGRRWEIDACLLRPRPRSRSGAGAARKAEFRARSWGWFGEGRWTADNKKSPVNFHARSKMLAAGCPPIDAASPLNILRKLGVLARK